MIVLRDPAQLAQVEDAYIRELLARRIAETTLEDDEPPVCLFVLAEPGDCIAQIEQVGGVSITTAAFTPAKYGDPGFVPSFEVLEEHPGHCFEMVHVTGGDEGVSTIVPDVEGIDPELLRFCKAFAVKVPAPDDEPAIIGGSYAPRI